MHEIWHSGNCCCKMKYNKEIEIYTCPKCGDSISKKEWEEKENSHLKKF